MVRKLLALAEKLQGLTDEEADMINGYLKILKSHWRISLTGGEEMKRAGKDLKKGFDKILGALKDGGENS